jgi:hypothetical protein
VTKEQINQKYQQLATKLGDLQFRMELLKLQQAPILQQIHELNQTVEILNRLEAEKVPNEAKKQDSPQS